MENDPYATPLTNVPSAGYTGNNALSQGVIQQLADTKPWVRFISVLMFIGAGLMLLIALVMLLMGGVMASTMASATKNPMFSGGFGMVVAAIYAVLAFVYVFPALKLWKYASCIGNLVVSGSISDLELALNEQRSFWKFIGILFLIIVSLYALVFIGGMIVAIFGAMSGHH